MLTDTGTFVTPKASQYLQQLCKHFGHKVDTHFDATSGRVAFPFGPATLSAEDGALRITVEAEDAEGLTRARSVIDKHLQRFAFREAFTQMAWANPEAI